MPKLVPIFPEKLIKILEKKGYRIDHITGSHFILYKGKSAPPIVVPKHHKEVKIGLLKSILTQACISNEEYELLRKKRKY